MILKYYAPVTAAYGFHFKSYDENIFTPVIRKQIRDIRPADHGHYTVYLPAYDDETLVKHLSQFKDAKWDIFSKHNKTPFTKANITIRPINNDQFIESMANSTGVLCGAGFEGPAEAMHLGKKVLAIPMLAQYEQQCNAAALEDIGVPVIKTLSEKHYSQIQSWISNGTVIPANYPDNIAMVIEKLMNEHATKHSFAFQKEMAISS